MPGVQLIPFCLVSFIPISCSSSPGCSLPEKGNTRGKTIPLAVFLHPKILGMGFPEGVLIWQLRLMIPPSVVGSWSFLLSASKEHQISFPLWCPRASFSREHCNASWSWDHLKIMKFTQQELSGVLVLPFWFWSCRFVVVPTGPSPLLFSDSWNSHVVM